MTEEQEKKQAEELKAERKRVAKMTDAEVLAATDHGKFGPAMVGVALAERSAKLVAASGGGVYGPAITQHDFAKKQAEKRAAEQAFAQENDEDDREPQGGEAGDDEDDEESGLDPKGERKGEIDPLDLKDPRNPWSFVTLSGAKMLAQKHGVNYLPKVKRLALIADLQTAKVVPPPAPTEEEQKAE